MFESNQPEITPTAPLEIEQPNYPEFEQVTEHPERDDTRAESDTANTIKSERLRFENADAIYD